MIISRSRLVKKEKLNEKHRHEKTKEKQLTKQF